MNTFFCEMCDYNTVKKQNYEKHLLSKKHLLNSTTENECKTYTCQICDKHCKTRSTLWSHKKICKVEENKQVNIEEIKKLLINQEKEVETLKHLIIELTKKDFATTSSTTTINNNIKNNNNFNINVFLNQDCKNAINFIDFINGIKLEIEDLLLLEKTEYVDGISQIIIKNMKNHSLYERPIHYQIEKEKIHIKDENKWKHKKEEVKYIFNNGIFHLDYNLVKNINDNRTTPRFCESLEMAIKNIRKESMFHTENDVNGKKILKQIVNDVKINNE